MQRLLVILFIILLFILVGAHQSVQAATVNSYDRNPGELDYIILDDSGLTFTPNPFNSGGFSVDEDKNTRIYTNKKPVSEPEDETITPVPLPGAIGFLLTGLISLFGLATYRSMKMFSNKED